MDRIRVLAYLFVFLTSLLALTILIVIRVERLQEMRSAPYQYFFPSVYYNKRFDRIERYDIPFDRTQIYEDRQFGFRIGVPVRWRVRASGPFDNKVAYVAFKASGDPPTFSGADVVLFIGPAATNQLPPSFEPMYLIHQLVKLPSGEGVIEGILEGRHVGTGAVFGYMHQYSDDSYLFQNFRNDFAFRVTTKPGFFRSREQFFTFLAGFEWFKPTKRILPKQDLIVDRACQLVLRKPEGWKFQKKGVCVNELVNPQGDVMYISSTTFFDLRDIGEWGEPLERRREQPNISGYPADAYFSGRSSFIVVHHPERTYVFSFLLQPKGGETALEQMRAIVESIEIAPDALKEEW